MQITKQADYAVRAMAYLAKLETNQRAATSDIAKAQKIPPSFLAKIISQLSISGLIYTSRGAHGGVMLSRPANKISMLDVVEAIDGPISLNDCTLAPETCDHTVDCPMHEIWSSLQKELVAKLSASTFDKFVR
jgi:Rrf2 family protein